MGIVDGGHEGGKGHEDDVGKDDLGELYGKVELSRVIEESVGEYGHNLRHENDGENGESGCCKCDERENFSGKDLCIFWGGVVFFGVSGGESGVYGAFCEDEA